MNDDKDTVNYMDSINKASRKRRRKPSFWEQYGILVIGAAVLAESDRCGGGIWRKGREHRQRKNGGGTGCI